MGCTRGVGRYFKRGFPHTSTQNALYDVHAYCTSTVQSERLRSCTWSIKWYSRVSNNRKDTNTATRTFSQLKQSQFMCGPLFEFSEAS